MPLFAKHAFGLDISDASVEAMVLRGSVKKAAIESYARVELREGVVENGTIHDPEALLSSLLELSNAAQPKPIRTPYVIISLPESRVSLVHISVPKMNDEKAFREAVMAHAEKTLPYEADEVIEDFHIVGESPDTADVLFAAVDKGIAETYRNVLERAYLQPIAFDVESACLGRSIARRVSGPLAILDIGARTSIFTIVELGNIQCSESIPIGGELFTKAIVQRLRAAKPKAELLKRTAGLDPIREKGRVLHVLQSHLRKLVEQINNTRAAWEKKSGRHVSRTVLCGGSSLLPRLPEYLTENLGLVTELGDPFEGIAREGVNLGSDENVLYATVVGLALRGISPHPERAGLNLLGTRGVQRSPAKVKKEAVPTPIETAEARTEPLISAPETRGPEEAKNVPVRMAKGGRRRGKKDERVGKNEMPEPVPPSAPVLPQASKPEKPPESPVEPPTATPATEETPPQLPGGERSRFRLMVFISILVVAVGILGYFFSQRSRTSTPGGAGSGPAGNTNESANVSVVTPPDTVPLAFTASFSADATKQTSIVLPARALATSLELSKTGTVSGTKTVNAPATGKATITSTWSFPQPLVATTRLLSAEGILFRLKDAVTVPANGSIEADVYADEAGSTGEINPTTFTIPGLNATKQKLITAKSEAKMTGGTRSVGTVSQADVDAVVGKLDADFRTNASTALAGQLASDEALIDDPVASSTSRQVVQPALGKESSEITVSETRSQTYYAVKKSDLDDLATSAFARTAPRQVPFSEYALSAFSFEVGSYDATAQTASVNVNVDANRTAN